MFNIDAKNKISILILLNPIIDLFTGVFQYNFDSSISFGGIFRIIILVCLVIDLFIQFYVKERIRFKRSFIVYFILFLGFSLIFGIRSLKQFGVLVSIKQVTYLIRYLSFPVYLISLASYIKELDTRSILKLLSQSATIYSSLIVLPFITKTGFDSYAMEGLSGSVGWFVGANEIGMIIGMTMMSNLVIFKENRTRDFYTIIQEFLPLVALLIIGTKAALVFFVLYISTLLVRTYRNTSFRYKLPLLILMIILMIITGLFTPAVQNLLYVVSISNPNQVLTILLSGRLTFLKRTFSNYLDASVISKLFGLGFMTINNKGFLVVDKLVEMDIFDILFSTGVVGLVVVFSPMVRLLRSFIKDENKKINWVIINTVILSTIFGFLIGHVFSAPSVSIFMSVYVLMIFYNRTI